METTLRMFYARALFALCFFFLAVLALAGVAFAQEAGPITVDQIAPQEDYTGLAGLANSALAGIASALALLIGAVVTRLWNLIPVWAQAAIDRLTTTDAKEWGEVVRNGTHDAVLSALVQLKMDPASIKSWEEKNATLALAGNVIERFYPELKSFTVDALDKNKNGVPDFLELALAKIAPQTAFITPPPPTQGFMSASTMEPRRMVKARASDGAVEALAQKFARQAKGAVKQ